VVETEAEAGPLGSRLSRVALLRRLCQLLGVQVAARTYDFTQAAVVLPGDVTGVVALVKTTAPRTVLPAAARDLQEADVALGNLDVGTAWASVQRALALCESVFVTAHDEYVAALEMLAKVLDVAGRPAEAAQNALRALQMQIQLSGLDSPRTAESHKLVASLLSDAGSYGKAMQHLLAARYILLLAAGDAHPELSQLYQHMFAVLEHIPKNTPASTAVTAATAAAGQEIKAPDLVRQLKGACLQLAKHRCVNLHHNAALCKLLGDLYFEAGDIDSAANEHRMAKMLFAGMFGEDSSAAQEANEALRKTMAVVIGEKVRVAKAMQEGAIKVKGEVPQPQPQKQPQKGQKKTGSYKALFGKNHSRLTR
jgi:hypothetical protein